MVANIMSFCTTKLDLYFHDVELGVATGFIYKYGQYVALVSNWHVFSGVNPITGKIRHSTKCRPNRVDFNININDPAEGSISIRGESMKIENNGQSHWWQHRGYMNQDGKPQIVDIAVLVLNEHLADFDEIKDKILAIPAQVIVRMDESGKELTFEYGYPRVAADVFILGYPKGLTMQGVLPVWKRGTVASEPLFPIGDNIPAMFVDAITREGMSGSPVLYFGDEITDILGRLGPTADPRLKPWLMGVYAGRDGVTGEEIEMALGRVWHKRMLDEIFGHRVPGDNKEF